MPSQQTLALLVKSLSKSEKRYFRLLTSLQEGRKYYVSLFDLFENDAIKLEDIKPRFIKKHSGIVYDSACKHLYKVLMRSLRSFQGETILELKLSNLFQEIKILYEKEIFDEFLFQINKLKALAQKNEKYFFYLQAAALEMEYYTRKEYSGQQEAELIEKQSEMDNVLDHIVTIRKHASLYEVLLFRLIHKGVVRSDADQLRLNDLVLAESQITSNPHYDTFESNKLHLLFQSVYFKIIGESSLSLDVYHELDALFEKNKTIWEDAPMYYICLIEGIILNLLNMKKHDSVPYFIDRLKVIKTRIPGLESQILPLLFQFEISMSIARENYNEAIMIVEKYDDQLKKKHTEFTPNSKAKVHFYTAVAYFGGEQYKKALGYLNKIVDLGEKLLMPELFIACRLVRMMIHYEMNHHEYLDYDIRSFERKLQKNGIFYKMEKIMVGLFKKNSNTMDVKTIRANFMACNNALSKLENTPFEMQLSNLFNFNAWLQKKRLHLSK